MMTEAERAEVAKLNVTLMRRCVCDCDDDGNVVTFCAEHKRLMEDEYERGKQHGLDDRRMIERRNQEQGREINALKSTLAADLGKDHVVRVQRFAEEDAAIVHILRPSLVPVGGVLAAGAGRAVTFNMSVIEATALRDLLNCTYPKDRPE